MYFQGMVTIDPAQLTHLDRVKPTKGFARMAHLLTGGLVTSKEERETFCAVSILQQINLAMRTLGIDNVVRLAKDDTVFFEDTQGQEGDLKQAFDVFSAKAKPDDLNSFHTLDLVLEHHTNDLAVLIDIRIHRTHRVGQHPIQIMLNGLPKQLIGHAEEQYDRGLLTNIFATQQKYDAFISTNTQLFTNFLNDLEAAFKGSMKVDQVDVDSSVRIIRPAKRVHLPSDVPESSDFVYDPIYQDYPGFGDAFFFAWLWSDLCHTHSIQCHDCTIVDSTGADLFAVGSAGFQAGEGNTMNVDQPFSLPVGEDIQVLPGNEYSPEIAGDETSKLNTYGSDAGEVGGWLSSLSSSFNFRDWSSEGCGGCSGGSCSGGGCGGS